MKSPKITTKPHMPLLHRKHGLGDVGDGGGYA